MISSLGFTWGRKHTLCNLQKYVLFDGNNASILQIWMLLLNLMIFAPPSSPTTLKLQTVPLKFLKLFRYVIVFVFVFAILTLIAAMTRAAPLQLFRPRGQFTLRQLQSRTSKHFSHFSSYLAALSSEYCSHSQTTWLCCASARRPPVGNIACTRVRSWPPSIGLLTQHLIDVKTCSSLDGKVDEKN